MDDRILSRPDVIRATRVIIEQGSMPHRLVVRELEPGAKWVVHTETFETADPLGESSARLVHVGFANGDYCRTLAEAFKTFEERAKRF